MNRIELLNHIELYRKTEDIILELDEKYGINVWGSNNVNFYNNYNLLIHNLLVNIFGDMKTDLIEEFIWGQINITFDELCEKLGI